MSYSHLRGNENASTKDDKSMYIHNGMAMSRLTAA